MDLHCRIAPGPVLAPVRGEPKAAAVCVLAGAVAVLVQAVRASKYVWIGLFVVVACTFNPIPPISLSPSLFLVLDALTLVLFMVSLRGLGTKPRLSIASITDRTPGSESL